MQPGATAARVRRTRRKERAVKTHETVLDVPKLAAAATMKALVYHGPGQRAWEERPRPSLREATDAIVRVSTTTICGTDLHILKGDVPTVTPGRILGHEGVGVVEEVGAGVSTLRKGDKVLISCITSCGKCDFCKKAMYSHCRNGGWILGHTIDGTQAEYVRVPYAETSLYRLPAGADEESFAMLSDILPTGFECGVLNGQVKPGDTVAIVGSGPIGLAALLTAQFYAPAEIVMIDTDANRLAAARALGATRILDASKETVVERVMELTDGLGADVVIEAVGVPAAFDTCQAIVAPGGRIANVGVHGKAVELHLERLWSHNITLTTRLVDTAATPMLMKLVESGKLRPSALVTHRFPLGEVMKAYDVFGNAAKERALKVVLANV
jgi:alcohol dehydrogenase